MKVLVLSGIIPLVVSFWPPLGFWRHGRALSVAQAIVLFLFGGWDVWATHRGHWSFAPDQVARPRILGLPIEEVLFFVVITFCCLFTWEALLFLRRKGRGR